MGVEPASCSAREMDTAWQVPVGGSAWFGGRPEMAVGKAYRSGTVRPHVAVWFWTRLVSPPRRP